MDANSIRKKLYKKYMGAFLPKVAKTLIKFHLMERIIIVRCDGGICSQINFYLVGRYFMDKGYRVKFDNDWFQLCGKDMNGIFDRKFDLLKVFPDLTYNIASSKETFYYRKCYRYINNSKENMEWCEKKPPTYFDGYYRLDPFVFKQNINKLRIDYSILDKKNKDILMQIQNGNSVAIHVRRGDLSNFVPSYGLPLCKQYFLCAIQELKHDIPLEKDTLFYYFFSDEPEWVRENLIPILLQEIESNYFVIDINGSDKGYMDLLLISGCKYIVTSKGSLGKFAAALAQRNVNKVFLVDGDRTEWWTKVLHNTKVVKID